MLVLEGVIAWLATHVEVFAALGSLIIGFVLSERSAKWRLGEQQATIRAVVLSDLIALKLAIMSERLMRAQAATAATTQTHALNLGDWAMLVSKANRMRLDDEEVVKRLSGTAASLRGIEPFLALRLDGTLMALAMPALISERCTGASLDKAAQDYLAGQIHELRSDIHQLCGDAIDECVSALAWRIGIRTWLAARIRLRRLRTELVLSDKQLQKFLLRLEAIASVCPDAFTGGHAPPKE